MVQQSRPSETRPRTVSVDRCDPLLSPPEILARISAPFDPRERKQFTGGELRGKRYLPIDAVRRRLNSAAVNWSWEIVSSRWDDRPQKDQAPMMTFQMVGRLTIPGLGSRDGMGVVDVRPGTGKDWISGAGSLALKQAARQFGMPLDLE